MHVICRAGEGGAEGSGMLLFGPPAHGLGFNLHYVSHMVAWAMQRGLVPAMVEVCRRCLGFGV